MGIYDQKKKVAVIAISIFLVVAMVLVVVVGILTTETDLADELDLPGTSHTKRVIEAFCKPTHYKKECVKSLASAEAKNKDDPKSLDPKKLAAEAFNLTRVEIASALVKFPSIEVGNVNDTRTNRALEICTQVAKISIRDIERSERSIDHLGKGDFELFIEDLRVWTGGVLTYQDVCLNSFANTTTKAGEKMKVLLLKSRERVANALAIIQEIEETPSQKKGPSDEEEGEKEGAHDEDEKGPHDEKEKEKHEANNEEEKEKEKEIAKEEPKNEKENGGSTNEKEKEGPKNEKENAKEEPTNEKAENKKEQEGPKNMKESVKEEVENEKEKEGLKNAKEGQNNEKKQEGPEKENAKEEPGSQEGKEGPEFETPKEESGSEKDKEGPKKEGTESEKGKEGPEFETPKEEPGSEKDKEGPKKEGTESEKGKEGPVNEKEGPDNNKEKAEGPQNEKEKEGEGHSSTKKPGPNEQRSGRMAGKVPEWVSDLKRNVLGMPLAEIKADVVVAKDGSGKVKTLREALHMVPKKTQTTFVIRVKEGVYHEHVAINGRMNSIILVGDGPTKTIISAAKNFADSWPTYTTGTIDIDGDGFMARDIGFENTAGPAKFQAVAARVTSDYSIFYNCHFSGYQYTLYTVRSRQFYRDCTISGTVDFISGDALAVFQNCQLLIRKPLPGQDVVVTGQARSDSNGPGALILQNCTITTEPGLDLGQSKAFLGRPKKPYSRTIIMQSFIDKVISPEGWTPFTGKLGLNTLFYSEFKNKGPGSAESGRVKWPGIKKLTTEEAVEFSPGKFFAGEDNWITNAGCPYYGNMLPME